MALIVWFAGCEKERNEMPTKGHVTMVVSESVAPLIEKEKKTFEELYTQAHVELQVTTAREAIARLFNDSITIIVSSRPLNNEEREVAKRANLTIGEYKIAYDGIAVIVNTMNGITQLRMTQLDSIFRGKLTQWKSAGSDLSSGIEVCVPERNSGTFEFAVTHILKKGDSLAVPSMRVKSELEMINVVAGHPSAIGIVGLDWLNDNKEKVKTLELADTEAPDSLLRGKYFGPHPAYVYQKYYPLTREIFIYSRADNYGVAAGFTSFITSGPGQKIILNEGLVPATMPIRLVETTSKPMQ
jgi:phosphate transport system substrate-binding protein